MVTWEELMKCQVDSNDHTNWGKIMKSQLEGDSIDWTIFITWVNIGIFGIAFWVWMVFVVIRIIYWLK